MINKAVASSLLIAGLVITISFSWVASPTSILDLIVRSVPLILIITVLIFVTILGASIVSRVIACSLLLVSGVLYFTYFLLPEWGVASVFIGFTFIADIGITANGCRSPMVSNANDNFLVVASIFFAGLLVGFCFELLNVTILGWWNLTPTMSYPMIDVSGINLIVIFTYAFIGFLLFEFATMIFTIVQRVMHGKENACRLEMLR